MRPIPALAALLLFGAAAFAQVPDSPAPWRVDPVENVPSQSGTVRSQAVTLNGSTLPSDSGDYLPQPTGAPAESKSPQPNRAPLRLGQPSEKNAVSRPSPQTPTGALTTVMASLAIVLGLFFLVVWFTRRALPKAATTLPAEVVEVLGRSALSGRQHLQVVRFGNKLLLVSVTATGATTLTEIEDGEEVERIAGLCREGAPGSISATFRQVLSQFASEPAPGGFLGEDPPEAAAPAGNEQTTRPSLQTSRG